MSSGTGSAVEVFSAHPPPIPVDPPVPASKPPAPVLEDVEAAPPAPPVPPLPATACWFAAEHANAWRDHSATPASTARMATPEARCARTRGRKAMPPPAGAKAPLHQEHARARGVKPKEPI